MLVGEMMTRDVVAVTEDDTVEHVDQLMVRGRFRHVPVIRPINAQKVPAWLARIEGTVVGIVSDRDIAVALAGGGDEARKRPMRQVMRTPVLTVVPDMPVEQAALLMADHQIGSLPVVADDGSGKLIGIITESDLFRALIRLLGVQEPSTRVRLLLPAGRVDLLVRALQVVADRGTALVGLVAEPVDHAGRWPIVMRLRTIYPTPIIQQIRELGIEVDKPPLASARSQSTPASAGSSRQAADEDRS